MLTSNWEEGKFYHVYNKAVYSNVLFKEDIHYYKFLEKIQTQILPIAKIYAYCLMPNHFHLLIQIKRTEEFSPVIISKINDNNQFHLMISRQFSHLFNGYAQWFNLKTERRGKLFELPFKKKLVDNDAYLAQVIGYIHNNPVHHGFTKDIFEWKFSSFWSFISDSSTKLEKAYVLDFFGDKEGFKKFHREFTLLELETLLE